MPARTAAEAVSEFLETLSAAVSCVTRRVLDNAGGYYPAEHPHAVYFPGGAVALDMSEYGAPRLTLITSIQYRVEQPAGTRGQWEVRIVAYEYVVKAADGPELLAYHWHPQRLPGLQGPPRTFVTTPHLHLGAGAGVVAPSLHRAHLPTGPISLQEILRLAIRDLGVRSQRPDWDRVLNRTQARMPDISA